MADGTHPAVGVLLLVPDPGRDPVPDRGLDLDLIVIQSLIVVLVLVPPLVLVLCGAAGDRTPDLMTAI
jgi:hypothetical protein